jgi:hypothetical protein
LAAAEKKPEAVAFQQQNLSAEHVFSDVHDLHRGGGVCHTHGCFCDTPPVDDEHPIDTLSMGDP